MPLGTHFGMGFICAMQEPNVSPQNDFTRNITVCGKKSSRDCVCAGTFAKKAPSTQIAGYKAGTQTLPCADSGSSLLILG